MPKPYQPQDHYFRKAKEEGYRARSAYKLLEIQERTRIFKRGNHVLDIGAAPGSWLQVLTTLVGPSGKIVGIDLEPIDPVPQVHTIQGDIITPATKDAIQMFHPEPFDIVVSDIAPKTSGIKDVDQYRSIELSEQVLLLCNTFLKRGGHVVLKVFVGADFQSFLKNMKTKFASTKNIKPKASRDRSFETYVVGKGFTS